MKTHKRHKTSRTENGSSIFDNVEKVKLKRKQYISNLLTTNQAILRNNNINTLLLF